MGFQFRNPGCIRNVRYQGRVGIVMRKQLLNFGLFTSAVCVLLMAVFILGPELETKFFPVYSKFRIVSIEVVDVTHTKVQFEYTKYRECPAQGFAWYTGELGAAFRQLSILRNGATNSTGPRPIGLQRSDVYIIDATIEQVREATFAQIYNDCHPGWLTKSNIYP